VHKIQKFSPTVIELGIADEVVITRNGKVVGYVEVKRESNNAVELLANPVVCPQDWSKPAQEAIYNSFSTTLATYVESPDDMASAQNFINFMNKLAKYNSAKAVV